MNPEEQTREAAGSSTTRESRSASSASQPSPADSRPQASTDSSDTSQNLSHPPNAHFQASLLPIPSHPPWQDIRPQNSPYNSDTRQTLPPTRQPALHPPHQNTRTQLSPYNSDSNQITTRTRQPRAPSPSSLHPQTSLYDSDSAQPLTRSRRTNSHPQAPRPSSPARSSSSSQENDEWTLISPSSTPTYTFSVPWPTALHDTSAALAHVSAATTSYAQALTRSGVGKAGWSVGRAMLGSANRGLMGVMGWMGERVGTRGLDGRWREESGRGRGRRRGRSRSEGNERDRGRSDVMVLDMSERGRSGEVVRGLVVVDGEDAWDEEEVEGGMGGWGSARDRCQGEDEDGEDGEDGEDEDGEDEDHEEGDGLMRMFEFDY